MMVSRFWLKNERAELTINPIKLSPIRRRKLKEATNPTATRETLGAFLLPIFTSFSISLRIRRDARCPTQIRFQARAD